MVTAGVGGAGRTGRDQPGGELFQHDGDRRLPWLEGDGEDEPDTRFEAGRALAAILGAMVLIALLAASAWWLLAAPSGAGPADGSIIEAPDTPYKVRPAQSGAAEVEGTGGVSFAVAEGQVREGRIAGEDAAGLGGEPENGAAAQTEDPAAGGSGVQIGAFPSREEASEAWVRLGGRIPALAGRGHRILEGSADSGAVFRLQAVAGSGADAAALCAAIREDGGDCQVKE